MKIIYDESKISELKKQIDEKNKWYLNEETEFYKRCTKIVAISAIIFAVISGVCFWLAIHNIQTTGSAAWLLVSIVGFSIFSSFLIFSIWFLVDNKSHHHIYIKNFEHKRNDFAYPASIIYSSIIEDKEPCNFAISGNPDEKTVDIEITVKSSEGKMKTETLYDFEVYRTVDCQETIIDLMNTRVIYPLEDETQKFEFCPAFEGNVLKKI